MIGLRHFLDVTDLEPGELWKVLDLAERPIGTVGTPLAGQGVALIFEKPSNRTRHSMEMAVVQLGGHPVYTRGEEIGLDVRETVEDVTRIMNGYHGLLAARVFRHEVVERMAAVAELPVVNLLSDRSHPMQALADVLTMQQTGGPLQGRTVAWIGDYNNVARSLGEAVAMLGGHLRYACPNGYGLDDSERERLTLLGAPSVEFCTRAADAVRGASAVHTDTWTSMGQEAEASARRQAFEGFQVDETLMSSAAPGALFFHCMPAHRDEEVSTEVFDGPRSMVIRQGHNRMHAARGLLAFLLGVR